MKMSDVFETALKCTTKEGAVSYLEERLTPLVELNKELVDALDGVISIHDRLIKEFNQRVEPWHEYDEEHLHAAWLLVQKSKELLKEQG